MTSFLKGTAQAFIAMWLISGIFNVVLLSNHKHYTKDLILNTRKFLHTDQLQPLNSL